MESDKAADKEIDVQELHYVVVVQQPLLWEMSAWNRARVGLGEGTYLKI